MTDLRLPEVLACLTRAEACRDSGTNTHEHRVAAIIYSLAETLGLPRQDCKQIATAGVVHDIGKLSIPVEILHKQGSLSSEEVALMKTHSLAGHHILASSSHNLVQLASQIALCHHERYDGTGYPEGLAADDIPIAAQMTSICDVYDALRSDRPYKKGMGHDVAMQIIAKGDNRTLPSHFAPAVLAAFVSIGDTAQRIFSMPQTELSRIIV